MISANVVAVPNVPAQGEMVQEAKLNVDWPANKLGSFLRPDVTVMELAKLLSKPELIPDTRYDV